MIGDDAVAERRLALAVDAAGFDRGRDQVAEQVDVVIVGDALQDGGDALQPHAGVDRGLAAGRGGSSFVHLLELHEDEIPDFEEAVAIFVRASRAGRRQTLVALVVEDFRAGAAGAGIAHRPEIVAGRDADDAVVGKAGDLLPQMPAPHRRWDRP